MNVYGRAPPTNMDMVRNSLILSLSLSPPLLSFSLYLSLSLSLSSLSFSGVRALVTTSLPGVVSHGRGACVATPRPSLSLSFSFFLFLSLFLSLYLSLTFFFPLSLSLEIVYGRAPPTNMDMVWNSLTLSPSLCLK